MKNDPIREAMEHLADYQRHSLGYDSPASERSAAQTEGSGQAEAPSGRVRAAAAARCRRGLDRARDAMSDYDPDTVGVDVGSPGSACGVAVVESRCPRVGGSRWRS
jgi:hypothetical protein